MREMLVNILHLITEDGMWAAAKPPIGDWCREEDGLYGMIESPRGCPQIECLPCGLIGNIPLVYFFPRLALSTLRGYKAYQFPDGAPTWIFGGVTDGTPPCEMATPTRGYQHGTNGICYVSMVDRYWLCSGDDEVLQEFYPSVKKTTIWTMNLRPDLGPDGIISVPKTETGYGVDWNEGCAYYGMTSHIAGLHLAQLRIAERMAEKVGDKEFAQKCREWINQGSNALETKLWTGRYYLNYYDPETGKKSDLIFSYQLDGETFARLHGVPGVFRGDRVKTALATIRQANVKLTKHGATLFANPDGTLPQKVGYEPYGQHGFLLPLIAMIYMYEGERDFGLELYRRLMEHVICKLGCTWEFPNQTRGDKETGEIVFGSDYYTNTVLWMLLAAMEGKDISGPTKPGGLVDRIIQAAR